MLPLVPQEFQPPPTARRRLLASSGSDGGIRPPLRRAPWAKWPSALGGLAALGVVAANASQAQPLLAQRQADPAGQCVVIDNDYDIDDMMAIPLVIANQRLAAIVQTEGTTRPDQAAPAVDALVNPRDAGSRRQAIPILVGGTQDETLAGRTWPWLPFFRAMMHRSNGLLANPGKPWRAEASYPDAMARAVADCTRVSILLLGPFTSFIHYAPLIREKLDRVVITGRRIAHPSQAHNNAAFNCRYDPSACQAAIAQLAGLKTFFVDLPDSPECQPAALQPGSCYSPSYAMVAGAPEAAGGSEAAGGRPGGLLEQGLAGRLRRALINGIRCSALYTTPATLGRPCSSLSTWEPTAVARGPGGKMLLWDQTTALFLIEPHRFAATSPPDHGSLDGTQWQPRLVDGSHLATAKALRLLWTELTNRAARFPW